MVSLPAAYPRVVVAVTVVILTTCYALPVKEWSPHSPAVVPKPDSDTLYDDYRTGTLEGFELLDRLKQYADSVNDNEVKNIHDTQQRPLQSKSRRKRDIVLTQPTFDEVEEDFIGLERITKILSVDVHYPNDVESLFYGTDFYIIITDASNTSNPSFCDSVKVYKFDTQTEQLELAITQDAPGVQDVDFFIYEDTYYVLVAQHGDGTARSAGLFVYLWNVAEPIVSQTFLQQQHVLIGQPKLVETIVGGDTQFIIVAEMLKTSVHGEAAVMFEWKGGHMDMFAVFAQPNLVRVVPFCVHSRVFLVLASSVDEYGDPETDTTILLYNLHLHKFETYQTITTYGAIDVGAFTFGTGVDIETFLLVANTYDERGKTPKSVIYKYNAVRFVPFQCLELEDISGWHIIHNDKVLINLVVYTPTEATFYEYDGWRFIETQVQFEPFSVAIPINAMSSQYANYTADLVLASHDEQNATLFNLFKIDYIPKNLVSAFGAEATDLCNSSRIIYENITNRHLLIEKVLPDVVRKDIGEFTVSGNVTFLKGFDADDIVIKDIEVKDGVVLTNEEEAQLERIINQKDANNESVETMNTELSNTVWIDVPTLQNVTGEKTFNILISPLDLTTGSLGVTSGIVNGDLVIQDLLDEMINTTTIEETISVPIRFGLGLSIAGNLTCDGTVNGVDTNEIVTLSRDHTITGQKTFTGGVTANGDVYVSGTVDGITLTSSTVLRTAGDQTVTGSYTFNAALTVDEDVSVTGTVDGVDLSTLKDEAVYLDGNHTITGPMTLSGGTTMTEGLTVTPTNTVDGVDIEDLDASILRLTVQQDVSANYTFTSPVTVEGNITVGGTVDHLYIPSDIVLIDDPNPNPKVIGPIKFTSDLTVDSLCIRDQINHIGVPDEYVSLDLLLTAPTSSKNRQTVTGEITFTEDIYLQNTTTISGRVDGIDLRRMQRDTVFFTTAQTITGAKTFAKDLTITNNLTVDGWINGVDINYLDDNAIKLSDGEINAVGTIDFSGAVTFVGAIETGGSHTFGATMTLSDLVTQGTNQTIGGAKGFASITSQGNIQVTSTINSIEIDRLYSDAIRLDDPSAYTVSSDWQFVNSISLVGDVNVLGLIDGIDLDNAVLLAGNQTITGATIFVATIEAIVDVDITGNLALDGGVNDELVESINDDTLKCTGDQIVTGSKLLEKLVVEDNLEISGTVTEVDVSDMNDAAIFITGSQTIADTKTFAAATTFNNVNFAVTIDGIAVPDWFATVLLQGGAAQTVVGAVSSVDVHLQGDVSVSTTVNDLVVEDMWANSAKTTDDSYSFAVDFATVRSQDDVTVSATVDGILIRRDAALADRPDQVFTGKKSFSAPQWFGADISVTLVNTIDILDLSQNVVKNTGVQTITAVKTFTNGLTVNGNLAVTGTVDGVDVADLAARAVVTSATEGTVQTITANVILTYAGARDDITYTGLVDTVDLPVLYASYWSRSTASQTITGDKVFTSLLVYPGASFTVRSLDLTGLLNSHNMDQLNEEVWMIAGVDTVYGVKTFTQCITIGGELSVDGMVDSVDISDNVMVTNSEQLVTGFKTFSSDLVIDGQNLNFEDDIEIDGVDVSDWNANAALLSSSYEIEPEITFDTVTFEANLVVSGACSGLDFSPTTVMTRSRDQTVTAAKTFQYGVQFDGNMDVTGTVQGADVVEIDTTSLTNIGDQTLAGTLTLQSGPTFSNITTSAFIDGEDVVDLYLRTQNTLGLDDFNDFLDDQCDLLENMHDAFQDQAYILRYPKLVQTTKTNGRAKWRGFYFNGVQWLLLAKASPNDILLTLATSEPACTYSNLYYWSEALGKYTMFKELQVDYAQDAAFFSEGGFLFLAIITSKFDKDCVSLKNLSSDTEPIRDPAFVHSVSLGEFEGIDDHYIVILVWSVSDDDFLVYQRLDGVGSVALDHYVDPILNQHCLAIANHRSVSKGNATSVVKSVIYCMATTATGFVHHAFIDTLGAVKIQPFVYDGVLHLAVANRLDTNQRTFLVESAIWGNFVKEVVITTSAASDVAVKQFQGHCFVAFANEFEGQRENYDIPVSIYSYEYDPEDGSTVDLVQEIPGFRVQSLEFMEIYDQLFLVVINRTSSVNIFRYEGMQMFQVIHTIPVKGAVNVAIYPFKNDPEQLHIATTAYATQSVLFSQGEGRSLNVDSFIFELYFQGFNIDTQGCSSP